MALLLFHLKPNTGARGNSRVAPRKKQNQPNQKTMKKLLTLALAAAFAIAAPGIASAKDKGAKGGAGKVTAVDDKSISVAHGKGGEPTTYKVTADTKVTVDGKEAKIGDVKVGMHATVTPGSAADTAASIDASDAKKKKKDK
jgi:hypothetical protein